MELVRIPSPNGRHAAQLFYAGEIPFGPEYYSLSVDSRAFNGRVFGHGVIWSPDSTILVVTEWHTTNVGEGPITSLLLVRPLDWSFSRISRVDKGFAFAIGFGNGLTLRHVAERHPPATRNQYVTDLASIDDWSSIEP